MKGVQTCLPFGSCLGITWSVRCCIIQTALQAVLGNYLTQLCSVPKILWVILHVPWLPSAWQKLSSKWSDAHLLCFLWQLLPWENSLRLHSEEALGRTERHAESIRERYRGYWVQCTKNILVHHGSPWLHHDPRVSFRTTGEFSYRKVHISCWTYFSVYISSFALSVENWKSKKRVLPCNYTTGGHVTRKNAGQAWSGDHRIHFLLQRTPFYHSLRRIQVMSHLNEYN